MKAPILVPLLLMGLLCARGTAQRASPTNADHFKGVDERGDKAMGFSHDITSHHFLLLKNGGAIEIEADDPNDSASKDAVRDHLIEIAKMFSQGDFELPMLIHATVPPGVDTMKRLKNDITYAAETTAHGARVLITTQNSEALTAIHDFLRFQITDHHTKDFLEVQE